MAVTTNITIEQMQIRHLLCAWPGCQWTGYALHNSGVPFQGDGVDVEDNLPALDGVMLNHISQAEGTRRRQLSPAEHRTGWMSPAQRLWCFLSGLK